MLVAAAVSMPSNSSVRRSGSGMALNCSIRGSRNGLRDNRVACDEPGVKTRVSTRRR